MAKNNNLIHFFAQNFVFFSSKKKFKTKTQQVLKGSKEAPARRMYSFILQYSNGL